MAETREKDKITYPGYRQLIEDIFYHPQSAFDIFSWKSNLGGRDLLKIHFMLSLSFPVFIFVKNLIISIIDYINYKESFHWIDGLSEAIEVWILFLGLIIFIRFMDIFRLYYKFWDRAKNFDPPPPWIFMVSFIPFSGSGIFLILPTPLNVLFIVLGFFYCLHLSYLGVKNLSNYSGEEFVKLLLMIGIFLLSITTVILSFNFFFRMI